MDPCSVDMTKAACGMTKQPLASNLWFDTLPSAGCAPGCFAPCWFLPYVGSRTRYPPGYMAGTIDIKCNFLVNILLVCNMNTPTLYTMKPFYPQGQQTQGQQTQGQQQMSNWQYRTYMQSNAKDIMKFNAMQYFQDSGNNPYAVDQLQTDMNKTPFMFDGIHDNQRPAYGYSNSDLKQQYLKKEQMKSKMVAPNIPASRF